MKNIVYLCGPINGCTDDEASTWRDTFKGLWSYDTLDPMRRGYRGVEDMAYREIVELDKIDVRLSDVILVNYVKPSVGTSMEVFYAHSIGKPVVVICNTDSISPWMKYHTTIFVSTVEDAIEACKKCCITTERP